MKKIFLSVVAICFCAGGFAQMGEQSVGVTINYGTEIEGIGLGVKYGYNISDQLRISPNFNYFFKKDNLTMWDINADFHYLFAVGGITKVYPLAGFSVAGYKLKYADINTSETKFGINLGAGAEFEVAPNWAVNFELKYRAMADIDQGIISIGGAYKF